MTVVVDATGTKLITTVAGASVNYSGITVGTGANALVVTVACAAAVTAPNAHWDTAGANQAMTLISAVETQTNVTTFMFGLRNPVAGLKTLNVAWTTSAKSNIEAISFTGAETTSDAKAFINANFASNAATVASIAIGLISPADSIAVASYATSATFSSITQTNIFTDTTNTGCEGGASRANGAGASILFTGADTGTTGNKVMVGFVVAPPPPVLPPPLSEPVRSKIAGALAIALMASGLFTAPLPVKEDIAKVDRWYTSWEGPVWPKKGLAAHEQQFLARSTFTPTAAGFYATVVFDWPDFARRKPQPLDTQPLAWNSIQTAAPKMAWTNWPDFAQRKPQLPDTKPLIWSNFTPAAAGFYATVVFDWPDFARRKPQPLDVQSLPWDSIQIAATPTGWNDPLEQPVRNWQRSPIYTAPFLALGVPPAQIWFPPNVTPDVVPTRAKPPVNFIPWTFLEPAPQAFFPYDRWPDTAPVAKRVAQNPDWSYGTFVTPTATTYTQWTQWPDFAIRTKPTVDSRPWSFVEPPPQVFFPYAPWDDFARRRPPQLPDTQPLIWSNFTPAAPGFYATVVFDWPDFARRKQPPLDTQLFSWSPTQFAVVAPTMAWTNWPDFAPRKKPVADLRPWTFLEPPPQVFFPYRPWDDFARRKPQLPDTKPLIWSNFTPAAAGFYATVVFDWPDFARRKPQPLDTQPLAEPINFTAATVINTWAQWPDFARRARPSIDPQSFAFLALTPSATVLGDWPDFAQRKPQLPDTQPQPYFLAPQAPGFYATVVFDWPDFAQRKPQLSDTQFLSWSAFTPAPAAAFFLVPDRWPDFATKKRPLNYDPLAFLQTVRSPFNSFVNWPDFATKKKPAADFVPWTFIPTPRQVFFPYGPWDDFTRRKLPLNYDPLAFLQTVRTPWVTMTTWPDFAPIRGKIGLHSAEQQFTARFPGTLFGATVTLTMSAFEVNTDGAAAAILVVQSQPAVDAAVSIQEIGILGGSVTP